MTKALHNEIIIWTLRSIKVHHDHFKYLTHQTLFDRKLEFYYWFVQYCFVIGCSKLVLNVEHRFLCLNSLIAFTGLFDCFFPHCIILLQFLTFFVFSLPPSCCPCPPIYCSEQMSLPSFCPFFFSLLGTMCTCVDHCWSIYTFELSLLSLCKIFRC